MDLEKIAESGARIAAAKIARGHDWQELYGPAWIRVERAYDKGHRNEKLLLDVAVRGARYSPEANNWVSVNGDKQSVAAIQASQMGELNSRRAWDWISQRMSGRYSVDWEKSDEELLSLWTALRPCRLRYGMQARVLLYLHVVERMSYVDIAAVLGIKYQAVQTRIEYLVNGIRIDIKKRKKLMKKPAYPIPQPGDMVRLETENKESNGKPARVVAPLYSTETGQQIGCHVETGFGSGRLRVTWNEMLPLDTTELMNPDVTLMKQPSRNGTAVGHKSPTGNPCPNCQGPNMVRTGTCVTCQDCYYNEGCG